MNGVNYLSPHGRLTDAFGAGLRYNGGKHLLRAFGPCNDEANGESSRGRKMTRSADLLGVKIGLT